MAQLGPARHNKNSNLGQCPVIVKNEFHTKEEALDAARDESEDSEIDLNEFDIAEGTPDYERFSNL